MLDADPPHEHRQPSLFETNDVAAADPGDLLDAAADDLNRWHTAGITVRTVLDPGYPANLRTVHDRPPLLFTRGDAEPAARAIAIVGSREASAKSLCQAGDITGALTPLNYVAISGLARGVDAAAHRAALDAGGRTDAVVGTGLLHAYPSEHAALQRDVVRQGLVFSQFWPGSPPRREHFPLRNVLMSGLTRATLIIAAGARSGTRIQAHAALRHGRPVLLHQDALDEPWLRELSDQPNVHVIATAQEAAAVLDRIYE